MSAPFCSAIRFALVGCGGIARHHLRAILGADHPATVAALVDTRKKNAEELLRLLPSEQAKSCQVFTDMSGLLSWDKYDAAVIMVPHHLHEPYATLCLQANKHVLLEKPLAHTLQSACILHEEVARATSSVCMIGEQSPYWPEVVKVSELLEGGAIGIPYHAMANYWESAGYSTFFDEEHFFAGGNWRFDPTQAGGGALMDGATHWTRPLSMWFGDIKEAVGVVDRPLAESRCETLAHALLSFQSGKMATLYCHFNRIPMTRLPFFQIFGDKGEITVEGSFDGGLCYKTCSTPEGVQIPSLGGFSAAFAPQMAEFVRLVVEGKMCGRTDSVEAATKELLLAQAVYKSVRTKQWEELSIDNLVQQ